MDGQDHKKESFLHHRPTALELADRDRAGHFGHHVELAEREDSFDEHDAVDVDTLSENDNGGLGDDELRTLNRVDDDDASVMCHSPLSHPSSLDNNAGDLESASENFSDLDDGGDFRSYSSGQPQVQQASCVKNPVFTYPMQRQPSSNVPAGQSNGVMPRSSLDDVQVPDYHTLSMLGQRPPFASAPLPSLMMPAGAKETGRGQDLYSLVAMTTTRLPARSTSQSRVDSHPYPPAGQLVHRRSFPDYSSERHHFEHQTQPVRRQHSQSSVPDRPARSMTADSQSHKSPLTSPLTSPQHAMTKTSSYATGYRQVSRESSDSLVSPSTPQFAQQDTSPQHQQQQHRPFYAVTAQTESKPSFHSLVRPPSHAVQSPQSVTAAIPSPAEYQKWPMATPPPGRIISIAHAPPPPQQTAGGTPVAGGFPTHNSAPFSPFIIPKTENMSPSPVQQVMHVPAAQSVLVPATMIGQPTFQAAPTQVVTPVPAGSLVINGPSVPIMAPIQHHGIAVPTLPSATAPPHPTQPSAHPQQQQQQQQQQVVAGGDAAKEKKHIKKPMNAYMLYLNSNRESIKAKINSKESSQVNKVAGEMWKQLSDEEKQVWFNSAQQLKEDHMKKYPGWSCRDNYDKKSKKRKRASASGDNTASVPPKKCRAVYGMENKSSWCKPCLRKKKCIKFTGENSGDGHDDNEDAVAEGQPPEKQAKPSHGVVSNTNVSSNSSASTSTGSDEDAATVGSQSTDHNEDDDDYDDGEDIDDEEFDVEDSDGADEEQDIEVQFPQVQTHCA